MAVQPLHILTIYHFACVPMAALVASSSSFVSHDSNTVDAAGYVRSYGALRRQWQGRCRLKPLVNGRVRAVTMIWKEVVDPKSGQSYYWNTKTNETSWKLPTSMPLDHLSVSRDHGGSLVDAQPIELPFDELTKILLAAVAADSSRFGDVANQYRPHCFEESYFEHLTHLIDTTSDEVQREALEKLRARLANPLLKNPPPY